VSQVAFEYLKRDRAVTVVLEPLKDDEIDIASEESAHSAEPSEWVARTVSSEDDLKPEHIADSFMKLDLSTLQETTLANGMRVVVVKHGEAPLVQASLLFKRNSTVDPPELFEFVQEFTTGPGNDPLPIATAANWAIWTPTGGLGTPKSWPLIRPEQDGTIRGNMIRFDARSPSGNLEQALWILRDEMESARPEVEGKKQYIKDLREDLTAGWGRRSWHIGDAENRFLYPDAPWLQSTPYEALETVGTWTNATVDTYLQTVLQPKNATLFFVGNIEPDKAKELAQTHFGGWSPPAGALPGALTMPKMPTEASKILVFDDPKSTQTELTIRCRLNVTDPVKQRAEVGVLSSLLGQQTFNTMRVLEGLAYSPGASAAIASDGSAALTFNASVINTGVGRMVQYSKGAVERVAKGEVPGEEIAINKLRAARIDGLEAQSLAQVTERLTEAVRTSSSWEWLNEHGQRLAEVDGDDLKALIAGCNDHSIVTLEGPKDVITPQLDELGYTYEVVEWRANGDELLWKYDPKAAKKKEKSRQKADKKKAKEDQKKEAKGATE
jgi:predicted Zn-dependent peptidase